MPALCYKTTLPPMYTLQMQSAQSTGIVPPEKNRAILSHHCWQLTVFHLCAFTFKHAQPLHGTKTET